MSTVKLHEFIDIYSKCAAVNPLRVEKMQNEAFKKQERIKS